MREVAARRDEAAPLAGSILVARGAVALGLTLLLIGAGLLLLPQPEGALLAIYALTLLPLGLNTRWVHLGFERAGAVAIARIAGEATMCGLVLTLVHHAGDVTRVPLAQLSGDLLAGLILALVLRSRGLGIALRRDWPMARAVMRRAFPLALHALLGLVVYNSDLLFLRATHTPADVGHYVAAYTPISFLLNLGVAYSQSLLPALTRLAPEPDRRLVLYHGALAQAFALAFPIAIGGGLLAKGIMGTIFGPGYLPGALPLAILLWTIPIAFYRNIPQMALVSLGQQELVLRTTTAAAILNTALNLMLVLPFGLVGAALATLLTELIRTALALRYAGQFGLTLPSARRLLRIVIAGLVMAGVVSLLAGRPVWLAILAGMGSYAAALVLVGGLRHKSGGGFELAG